MSRRGRKEVEDRQCTGEENRGEETRGCSKRKSERESWACTVTFYR